MGCLDSCLRFDHCVSFDFMQSSAPNGKICRIYDGNQHTVRLVPERDWIHFNVSSAYLRKILATAEEECKGIETDETSSTLESSLQTHINVTMDEYCQTTALTVQSCAKKKRQGNCSGAWKAQDLADGWCCVDPHSPSDHCCCPIPQ
ncbi:uncharacterized protein LOC111325492 isoform X3 [Stylophora pistillata]|nr:uncharacterized protein LOC111325492 isoform X3 [Stylophora pistillata]XP_022785050.1 uncharacterized protein LOC111325492 isoform X3 [Stylophora pistillata]XP_022785051.1 uncharacterized protein LOC111325492 isoform X3 [Stylophora pistillata]